MSSSSASPALLVGRATRKRVVAVGPGPAGAGRTTVSVFGVLAALAGIEHGIGEILQGWTTPQSLVVESWPDFAVMEVLAGEPAMTIIPNFAVTGTLAIMTAIALGVSAVRLTGRRHGGPGLIMLSVLLLLVGGGFGPPLLGILVGMWVGRTAVASRRRPGRTATILGWTWPWFLTVAVLSYLALLPGTVILAWLVGEPDPDLVYGLMAFSFASLGLALLAARSRDRAWLQVHSRQ